MDAPTIIQAVKLLDIPIAFGIAGYAFSASQVCMPLIYDKPASISVPMFAKFFSNGATVAIPSAVISVLASGYLAYSLPNQRLLWTVASTAPLCSLPYTGLVMAPGIQRLLTISESTVEQEKAEKSGEHVGLLKAWTAHNYVRAVLYFTGAMCGLVATVGI